MTYEGVPGLIETKEAHGETTLVVDPARLVEACTYLRDELDFRFLSDITPTDYLGWGAGQPAGYYGTAAGRDLNAPGTTALSHVPPPKPKRFSMSYHLLRLAEGAGRAGGAPARPGADRVGASSRSGRPPTGTSGRPGT